MLNVDPVKLLESYPKSTLIARRVRAALGGRIYYFNGQKSRVRVFNALVGQVPFQNFVETGTFLGMTTDFLARTARGCRAQVYSCEIDQRHYAIANSAVGYRRNVHLHHGNSVDYLRSLASRLSRAVNFVYLDAHWYDYLPLRDELTIVREWNNSIVMIDDFKVPSDGRFGWDKYDDEREICLEHIYGAMGDNDVYFPAYPATDEGAEAARGYCMIAMSAPLRRTLDRIDLLERHGRPGGGTVRQQLDDKPWRLTHFFVRTSPKGHAAMPPGPLARQCLLQPGLHQLSWSTGRPRLAAMASTADLSTHCWDEG